MNWLKKLLSGPINAFKADVLREIDRAERKLQSGETAEAVIKALQQAVAEALAKTRLPVPLGAVLASMLLLVDWGGLAKMPTEKALTELHRLRKQVEGARL